MNTITDKIDGLNKEVEQAAIKRNLTVDSLTEVLDKATIKVQLSRKNMKQNLSIKLTFYEKLLFIELGNGGNYVKFPLSNIDEVIEALQIFKKIATQDYDEAVDKLKGIIAGKNI
jgi:hypothetical protein